MKRELKRICALFIAVSCMFSGFSIRIHAEEEIPEDTVEITVQTEGEQNNDELFAGYVDQLFSAPKPVTAGGKKAASRKAVNLEGAELAMYNRLHEMASAIAAGERDNAIITFDDAELGLGEQMTWTAERLDVSSVYSDDGIPEDAKRALDTDLTDYYPLNGRKVISLLMANYPYEFYWYDKSIGFTYSYNIGVTFGSDGYALYVTDYQLKMAVAEEYRDMNIEEDPDGNYLCAVNTAVTGAAVTAASNAREIVSQYASLDDTEKLTAYKDKICELVSYNDDAAHNENTAYGNPWQLIWVFDGNETTNVVCEGYSKAFQYLCDMSEFNSSSIACISVTGIMSSDNGSDNHMWNIVTLDDEKNYMADITNSDEGMAGQYGELFLAKQSSGSVDEGYVFQCPGKEIEYEYDEDTLSIYDKNELRLNYEYKENMCGETAYWNLDDTTGILTISGSGEVWSARDESGETEVHECPWQLIKQQIKGVVFEEGITTVGNAVFEDCINLRTVSFCDSITKIGHFAFQHCPIEEVDLPDHLQYIGGGVFTGSLITEVSIPASVTFLMDAFDGCTELRKVYIACPSPDYTGFIHSTLFLGCSKLDTIEVSPDNPVFDVVDNVLYYTYESEGKVIRMLRCYPMGKEESSFIVPDDTDEIGTQSFFRSNLESVTLSDSVTAICQGAFENCSKLSEIQFAGKLKTIDNTAFYECTSLSSISIPEGVTRIGPNAFSKCTSLKNVSLPDSLIDLGEGAFIWCDSIESIIIPESITVIGRSTFNGCTSLTDITIPAEVKAIGMEAFRNCTSLSNIYYKSCCEDWSSIIIDEYNEVLADPKIHYEGISLDHWEWSDDKETATAYFVCSKHNEIEKEITIQTTKKTTGNETEYIASVEFNGYTYTDVKKDSEFDSEHNYRISETVWGDDYSSAKVVLLSKNDPSFEMTLDAVVSEPVIVQPTCETDGFIRYSAAVVYDEEEYATVFEEVKPALGHQYGEPIYEWSEDNSTVTATAICENDNTHVVSETVNTTSEDTATCTMAGQKTYTAVFENNMFESQFRNIDVPALGHDYELMEWNWYDYPGIMQATLVCKNDPSHIAYPTAYVEKEIIPATCEEAGKTIYIATLTYEGKEYTGNIEEIIPATGHLYGIPTYELSDDYTTMTATVICSHDNSHIITETAKTVSEDTRPATCETDGIRTYTASFTNALFETYSISVAIPATGHKYGEPTYNWADDNSTVIGTIVCANDDTHTITETVNTVYAVTKPATPTEDGTGTYTAVFENELFTTQTKDIVIPATGYTYKDPVYTWADDNSAVTAVAESNEDPAVKIEETVKPSYEVIKEADCETDGEGKYTASFTNTLFETQTKLVAIPATDHDYELVEWSWYAYPGIMQATLACKNNSSHMAYPTAYVEKEIIPATCEEEGKTVYTATLTYEGKDYTGNIEEIIPATGHLYGIPTYELSDDYTTMTATVICSHDSSHIITETAKTVSEDTRPATCEEDGSRTYTASFTNTLFETQSFTVTIPATGHKYGEPNYNWSDDNSTVTGTIVCANDDTHTITETVNTVYAVTTPATPTEDGTGTYTAEFANELFETQTKEIVIPATGYTYKDPVYTWAEDNSTVTAVAESNEDPEIKIEETADTEYTVTVKPGCETEGEGKYTASFKNALFETQTKTVTILATGHPYELTGWTWAEDCSTAKATFTCKNDASHVQTVSGTITSETTPATCEAAGKTVYTAKAVFEGKDYTDVKEQTISALGHKYGTPTYEWDGLTKVTATADCEHDASHKVTETVNTTSAVTKEATCETDGVRTYTAAFTKEQFTTQTKTEVIFAIGHNYEQTGWTWAEDYSTASVTFTCQNDESHVQTVTATIESETTDATCEETGKTVYTATATFEGKDYSDTKEEAIPATGHKYGSPSYDWSDDNKTVTAYVECLNDNTHFVRETVNTVYAITKPATPAEDGTGTYTAEFQNDLFEAQMKDIVIPATGYTYKEPVYTWAEDNSTVTAVAESNEDPSVKIEETADVMIQDTAASCEADGLRTYTASFANLMFETQTKTETIPATGHDYALTGWSWAEDFSTATVKFTCKNDPEHVETVSVAITFETTPATCEEAGKTVYTAKATFESKDYTDVKEEEIPALGHKYGTPTYEWDGLTSVTATAVCEHDASHIETETVSTTSKVTTPATCETDGVRTYTAAFEKYLFSAQTKTEVIPATGHDYELTGWTWAEDYSTASVTFTCKNDSTHVQTVTAAVTSETTDATCEIAGKTVYTAKATFEGKEYTDTKEQTVPATGHVYELTNWTWAYDYSSATVKFTCKNDSTHVQTIKATVTSKTTAAACETAGKTVYTAKATFEGKEYTDTKEQTIPATGHKYGTPTYTWSIDSSSVTAKAVCANHSSHIETETVSTTSKVATPATCETDGVRTYTATFKNSMFKTQTKTETIKATGHKYGTPTYTWSSDNSSVTAIAVCANDSGHTVTETAKTAYKVTKQATTEAEGTGVYTAEFKNAMFKTQTKTVMIPKLTPTPTPAPTPTAKPTPTPTATPTPTVKPTPTPTPTAKPTPTPTAKPTPTPTATPEVKAVAMHRLYNPNSYEHFYTGNAKEKDVLVSIGWKYEGIGWYAPETSNTPVYRLYNPNNGGDHHYTKNKKEYDALVKAGWIGESVRWFSDDKETVPVYREYNPGLAIRNHNYTANRKEHDALISFGWKDEGIGWYGVNN